MQLAEVGPRFEMRRMCCFTVGLYICSVAYEIRLGTADIADADIEWVLRPYHRTARKREML